MPQENKYWRDRSQLFYYSYIRNLLNAFARDAKSIVDVGSNGTPILEHCTWINEKVSIDLKVPYESENVKGIKTDFLHFEAENKFDFCTCFQVLEHIEKAADFAKKLFDISDSVLISIPYKWKPTSEKSGHVHHEIDEAKLLEWTNRNPRYKIIVPELTSAPCNRRLIAFYCDPKRSPNRELVIARKDGLLY